MRRERRAQTYTGAAAVLPPEPCTSAMDPMGITHPLSPMNPLNPVGLYALDDCPHHDSEPSAPDPGDTSSPSFDGGGGDYGGGDSGGFSGGDSGE